MNGRRYFNDEQGSRSYDRRNYSNDDSWDNNGYKSNNFEHGRYDKNRFYDQNDWNGDFRESQDNDYNEEDGRDFQNDYPGSRRYYGESDRDDRPGFWRDERGNGYFEDPEREATWRDTGYFYGTGNRTSKYVVRGHGARRRILERKLRNGGKDDNKPRKGPYPKKSKKKKTPDVFAPAGYNPLSDI